ncbi:MAG: thiamine-phosphate kinase [Gammaproteobacteria bacterium]|nr:thiamine-phosphate kinase [Gammaproteobacteria bacterium]
MDEFALIDRYFRRQTVTREDVALGIGDDAAIVVPRSGEQLVAAVDTLVAGRHFPDWFSAAEIGYRALAVNLSDLAAMGAEPRWALLALTLPEVAAAWLDDFSTGFLDLARKHRVALIGGDTTQGPLTISVTLLGVCERALTRAGAMVGDAIFVTGTLGDAALALALDADDDGESAGRLRAHFSRPEPRVAAGLALHDFAHAAIDVSDGLLGDLGHILRASKVGARIDGRCLPTSAAARALFTPERILTAAATGGDDYELLFTAPAQLEASIRDRLAGCDCPVTRIGTIVAGDAFELSGLDGVPMQPARTGFRHFAT